MRIVFVVVLVTAALFGLEASRSSSSAHSASEVAATPAARTTDGKPIDALRLGNSDYCGHCHADVFHQWNASTHHFSSFNNPVYRRVALDAAKRRGDELLKFCANCHDPLPLLAGEIPTDDLNRWAPNAGITCLACHRITAIHGTNGAYTVSAPILHPFALSDQPTQQRLHEWMMRITPALHRAVLSKPFYKSSEYCATCHTVTSPAALNGQRDLPMQDEHGQWQRSHYSNADASGTPRKTCIDCHMPLVPSKDPAAKNGMIRSHRFPGGNSFLPAINRDEDQLRATEQFLRNHVVELRCMAVQRDSFIAPLPCDGFRTSAGGRIELHLQIVNTGVGHNFPAGTAESNEAWLELEIHDADGRELLHAGGIDDRGNVSASALFLRTVYADKNGVLVDRRNATTDAVVAIADTTIAAGHGRTVIYELAVPSSARMPLTLRARVQWRKYSPVFLRWVFDGRDSPEPPLTVMAELTATLGNP